MEHRQPGNTGLKLSALSFGASSLGQEFRDVDLGEAIRAVHVALDVGMNFIDTSPYYGRGMSEVLLGVELKPIEKWEFYKVVSTADHVLTIQTADQQRFANLLLTVGVRME